MYVYVCVRERACEKEVKGEKRRGKMKDRRGEVYLEK